MQKHNWITGPPFPRTYHVTLNSCLHSVACLLLCLYCIKYCVVIMLQNDRLGCNYQCRILCAGLHIIWQWMSMCHCAQNSHVKSFCNSYTTSSGIGYPCAIGHCCCEV